MSDQQPSAKRRRFAKKACTSCRKAHAGCDSVRPCYRCKLKGLACDADDGSIAADEQQDSIDRGAGSSSSQQLIQTPQQQQQQAMGYMPVQYNNGSEYFDTSASSLQPNLLPTSPDIFSEFNNNIDIEAYLTNELINSMPEMKQLPISVAESAATPYNNTTPAQQQDTSSNNNSPANFIDPAIIANVQRAVVHQTLQQQQPQPQQQQQQAIHMQLQQQVSQQQGVQVLDRLAKIEHVISAQNNIITDLVANYNNFGTRGSPISHEGSESSPGMVGPAAASSNNNNQAWRILEQVVCSIITIRDCKTLKLLGCNEAFKLFFRQRKSSILTHINSDEDAFSRKIDPLYLLLLLNIVRDKNRKLMKTKVLWMMGNDQTPLLMDMTVHLEDGFFWTEHKEINPPIFDDSFTMDDTVHNATMSVELSMSNPAEAKQRYDEISKKRYYTMISQFLNEKIHDKRLQHISSGYAINGSGTNNGNQ